MLSPPYWIFAENFPKAGRIGKSFLVLLGCPSGRYYLGTTVCQGLLPSHRHFEKREDPGDEVGMGEVLVGCLRCFPTALILLPFALSLKTLYISKETLSMRDKS